MRSSWTRIGRSPRDACLIKFPRPLAELADLVAEVPEEHECRAHHIEGVHHPDRSGGHAEDVDGVDRVAEVGQGDVAQAVTAEVLGPASLVKHRKCAADEQCRRDRTGQQADAVHRATWPGSASSISFSLLPARSRCCATRKKENERSFGDTPTCRMCGGHVDMSIVPKRS